MRPLSIRATTVITALGLSLLLSVSTSSQGRRLGRLEIEEIGNREAVAREVLVKLRDSLPSGRVAQILADLDHESPNPSGDQESFTSVPSR